MTTNQQGSELLGWQFLRDDLRHAREAVEACIAQVDDYDIEGFLDLKSIMAELRQMEQRVKERLRQ